MIKNFMILGLVIGLFSGCTDKNSDNSLVDENASANISDINPFGDTGMNGEGTGGVSSGLNGSSDGYQSIYFDTARYDVRADQQSILSQNNAKLAQDTSSGQMVKLEGSCDPRGNDEYNYALGLKRAKAVKDRVVGAGVDTANVAMVSMGESAPTCYEQNDGCWSQLRRVDFKALK